MKKSPDSLEFTSFITPDGVEYKFDTSYRFLMTIEGEGMPSINYITQKSPFQHGETLIDYRLQPRVIQMVLDHKGKSRDDYWANRTSLLNAVRPNRGSVGFVGQGTLRKIFSNGNIRDLDCVIQQGPVFSARDIGVWNEYGFRETLRFIAYDPTFYDPTPLIYSMSPIRDEAALTNLIFPFSFPFQLGSSIASDSNSIVYDGTWLAYPKIVLVGPMREYEVHNLSTGEALFLRHTLIFGETVTIDLAFGRKTVISSLGIDLNGSIDGDLMTFHIAPAGEVTGGINQIDIIVRGTNDDESAMSFEIYKRFIGI